MTTVSGSFKLQVVVPVVGFVPPYNTALQAMTDGSTIAISGDPGTPTGASGNVALGAAATSYRGNCINDIRPAEVASSWSGAITANDSGMGFVASYSEGGAAVVAMAGGHHGQMQLGATIFDFTDALWKRIWTTNGVAGDNITDCNAGNSWQDVRAGTRVHNCLHNVPVGAPTGYDIDLHCGYVRTAGVITFNSDEWDFTTGSVQPLNQITKNPRAANPWQQTWEVTSQEPAAYNASTNTHGWKYPGQWANLQGAANIEASYMSPSSVRFQATGWLLTPGHIWDLFYEITPAMGGGTKGSIGVMRSMAQTYLSQDYTAVSHAFDLNAGTCSVFSTNSSRNLAPAAGQPAWQGGSTAGAFDSVADSNRGRVFLIGQNFGGGSGSGLNRVNYMNLADRVWRGFTVPAASMSRSETMVVDPVRRLLLVQSLTAPYIRAIDLAQLTGEPTPTSSTLGWQALPNFTIAPGFQEAWDGLDSWTVGGHVSPGARGGASGLFNGKWVYYPPNGKFYRLSARPPIDTGYECRTASAYWGYTVGQQSPAIGASQGLVTKLQRLTPPPIIASPPTGYYLSSPQAWTFDEITISPGVPNAAKYCAFQSIGPTKRLHYVPSIQRLAWLPVDGTSSTGDFATRNAVYLIKPY